jgi:hypothetical protein
MAIVEENVTSSAGAKSGPVEQSRALVTAQDVLTQVRMIREVMEAVMKPDVHYGIIPGTGKPSLWKPGAEVLCATFRIADSYTIEDLSTDDCVRYRVRCKGVHQTTGIVMGEGIGECSSNEKKYKWVKAYPREFGATPENRRRKVYGWDAQKRTEYEVLQVRTDPADVANTILKMAAKRAKIAMVLNVTAASDMFSQDLEDLDERLRGMADEDSNGDRSEPAASRSEQVAERLTTPKIDKVIEAFKAAEDVPAINEAMKLALKLKTDEHKAQANEAYREAVARLKKGPQAMQDAEPKGPTVEEVRASIAKAIKAKQIDELDLAGSLIENLAAPDDVKAALKADYASGKAELAA